MALAMADYVEQEEEDRRGAGTDVVMACDAHTKTQDAEKNIEQHEKRDEREEASNHDRDNILS